MRPCPHPVALLCAILLPLPALGAVLDNPGFDTDLSGWTVRESGGTAAPGTVVADGSTALIQEGDSLLVRLEQTFVVPVRATTLTFQLLPEPGFSTASAGIPDAFEARLIDADKASVVATWKPGSSAFFQLGTDGQAHPATGATWDGQTVSVDTSGLVPGTEVTLSLSLVGDDADTDAAVRIDAVDFGVHNAAPVAAAGPDQQIACGTGFTLDGTGSSDADGDTLIYRWTDDTGAEVATGATPALSRPFGVWPFTLTVTDIFGETHTDDVVITVVDTDAPMLTVPPATEVPADAQCEGVVPDLVSLTTTADTCSSVALTQDPPAGTPLVLGSTVVVTLTASDAAGNDTVDDVPVTLTDPGSLCILVDSDTDTDILPHTDTGDSDTDTDVLVDTDDTDTDVPDDTDTDLPDDTDDTDTDPPVDSDTDDTDPPLDSDTDDTDILVDTDDTDDTDEGLETDPPDTDPADDTDTDAQPDSDTDPTADTDGTSDTDAVPDDKGDCSCANSSPSGLGATLGAMLLLAGIRRRRHLSATLPVLLVGMLLVPGLARADVPLVLDADVAGGLALVDDAEVYTFTATPGQRIFVDMLSSSGAAQGRWALTDAYGRVLGATGNLSDLGVLTLMGGDYTLTVTAQSDAMTYTFRVHTVPTLDKGAVALDTPISDATTRPGEVHTYTFDAAPGTRVALQATSVTNPNFLTWELTDALGHPLRPSGTFYSKSPATLQGGTYTITVAGRNDDVASYTFTVIDVASGAGTLTLGTPVSGGIGSYQVTDYAFTLAAPTVVGLQVLQSTNAVRINPSILDRHGFPVMPTSGTLSDRGPFALDAGPHTLRLESESGYSGTYEVQLVSVTDQASTASLGDTLQVTLDAPGQLARITFDALEGDRFAIDHVSGNLNQFNWQLQDPAGDVVQPFTSSMYWVEPLTLGAGTHTLTIREENASTGTSEFTLVSPTDAVSTTAIGGTFAGTLTQPGDTFTATFTAAPGQILDLNLASATNGHLLGLALTDDLGRDVISRTSSLASHTGIALLGGTYTLSVDGEADALAAFSYDLVDAGTSTYTAPSGTPIVLDAEVSATLAAQGTPDVYTLTLTQDTDVMIDLVAGGSTLDWQLLDPQGQPVFSLRDARFPASQDIDRVSLRAGTYTLEFIDASATPSYQFTVYEVPPDTLAPLTLGDVLTDAFTTPQGRHAYSFTLADPTRVFFALDTAHADLRWSLIDPRGHVRFDGEARFATTQDVGPRWLDAGTWTLVVYGIRDELPNYGIQVLEALERTSPIPVGTEVVDGIDTAGATLTLEVPLLEGTAYTIDILTAASGVSMTLVDPLGQVRDTRTISNTNTDLGPFTAIGGTWQLRFTQAAGQTASFALQISESPVQQSTALLDQPVEGLIASPGAVVRHTLLVPEAQAVYFDVTSTLSRGQWSVYDSVGEAVFTDAVLTNTTSGDRGRYTLRGGTYTIEARAQYSGTGPYGFTVRTVTDKQGTVHFGREVDDALSGPGAINRWSVDIRAHGTILMSDLEYGEIYQDWTLIDPVGQPVFDWTRARYDTDDFADIALAAGTYTVGFLADGDNVTAHTFTLRASEPGDPALCDASVQPALADCNTNGVTDICDVLDPAIQDCNTNYEPDSCELEAEGDCDNNGQPDDCYDCPDIEMVIVFDTSASLADEAASLCTNLQAAIDALELQGIRTNPTILGIVDTPEAFPCLTGTVLDLYGAEVPLNPTGGLDTLGDCSIGGVLAGAQEDWARAVSVVAARHPWQFGVGRVIVPIADEGAHCGAPDNLDDDIAIAHSITVARAFDVQVHPITGAGSTQAVIDLAANLADATGGIQQRSTTNPDRYLEFIESIATDACLDLFDCDRNDVPDSCQQAAGEVVTCACGRLPDICACDGPPTISQLDPLSGAVFAPGQQVTLTGVATPSEADQRVAAVLVNGRAAHAIDALGRFFATITVQPGDNLVVVEALDRCGSTTTQIVLTGDPQASTEAYGVVSDSITEDFTGTAWGSDRSQLLVDVRGHNDSTSWVPGPLLMSVGPELTPSVHLRNADGFTADGQAYVQLLDGAGAIAPDAASDWRSLLFDVPDQGTLHLAPVWLTPLREAPSFTTFPVPWVRATQPWTYAPAAIDPAGHALTWSLPIGPHAMTIDPLTGVLAWTPSLSDIGLHELVLVVQDGFGGRAEQRLALEVRPPTDNAPPTFQAAPPTYAAAGVSFSYVAQATDADGDPLTWTLDEGPPGMSVDAGNGLITWPSPAVGAWPVRLTVADDQGGATLQAWTLTVGAFPDGGGSPRIVSTPPLSAQAGSLYVYQPAAFDPDGDVLTWTLDEGPPAVSFDPTTGRLIWAPAPGDAGANALAMSVSDGRGGAAQQRWTVVVTPSASDRAPVFHTVPPANALGDVLLSYAAQATDPEGQAVTYALGTAPAGMAVDPTSGLLTWTPTPADAGTHPVELQAADTGGVTARQSFTLTVRGANSVPQITTASLPDAIAGQAWNGDVDATDGDADALTYTLTEGPAGMTIRSWNGSLQWMPSSADLGSHTVRVGVHDPYGGSDEATFTLSVAADTSPPVVQIVLAGSPGCLDQPLQVCVGATDDVSVVARTLQADGVHVPLTGNCAHLVRTSAGVVSLLADATDASGNGESVQLDLPFVDCNDPEVPLVSLVSPPLGEALLAPTDLVVSISDNTPAALSWTVSLSPHGADTWTTLATGTGPVDAAAVALLDTTLLPNDDYDIRVLAQDGAHEEGFIATYGVGGDMKLGNFSVTFTDLVVQLEGIPLSIARTYNSLDVSPGDFGPGWRLGLAGRVWDTPDEGIPNNPLSDMTAESFRNDSRVYVIKPSGERVGFTFDPEARSYPAAFQYTVRFKPDPGVEDELTAVGPQNVWNLGAGFADYIIPYNPKQYVLTTPERIRYTYDESEGLIRVDDAYGHTITVTPDGLVHSDGTAVTFERNAAGAITRILEPDDDPNDGIDPPSLTYGYDAQGRLISAANQLGHADTFGYTATGFPFHLTDITDATGRSRSRTVFDDEGRIIAQCPADGDLVTLDNCTRFDTDAPTGFFSQIDARGYQVDFFHDDRGEVVLERHYLDGNEELDIRYTWDERGNQLTRSLGSQTWTATYDDQDRILTLSDPDQRTRRFVYASDCDQATTLIDAMGATEHFTWDEGCRIASVTDRAGQTHTFERYDSGLLWHIDGPNGRTWAYGYNDQGQKVWAQDAAGLYYEWDFTRDGHLLSQLDRDGRQVQFTYDEAGRMMTETWNTQPATSIAYVYDDAGRLLSATGTDATLTRTIAATGHVASESWAGTPGAPAMMVSVHHNGAGLVDEVTDSAGGTTTYTYDGMRRLSGIVAAGSPTTRIELDHDEAGRMVAVRRRANSTLVATTDLSYDSGGARSRLAGIDHRDAGGASLHAMAYTRDAEANITALTDAEGAHAYTYDARQHLLSATHPPAGIQPDETYTWGALGSRLTSHLSASHTYADDAGPAVHRLTEDDAFTWSYDHEGHVTARVDRTTGERLELDWDHRNRIQAIRRVVGGSTAQEVSYLYDAAGRRIAETVDGVTTWVIWDAGNPIVELDSAGNVLTRRVYGRALDQLFAVDHGAGMVFTLTDHVGSVRDTVDATGGLVDHHVYDSFGQSLTPTPAEGFAGLRAEPIAGLLHARARTYDPASGRFLSEDPLAPFRYGYAEGNPLLFADPSGESVAIEYACLATMSANTALGFGTSVGLPLYQIFMDVAAGLNGAIPEGGDHGLAKGAAGMMTGAMGPGALPFSDTPVKDTALILLGGMCAGNSAANSNSGGPPGWGPSLR